jgi:glycosyltransferase 2 family protein
VKQYLITAAKLIWLVLIIAAVAYYLLTRGEQVRTQLQQVAIVRVVASLALLLIGRLLLAQLARRSIQVFDRDILYWQMLRGFSISEPAKYLPGGIWHFVGRAGIYRQYALSPAVIARALLRENVWLVLSAVIMGSGAWVLSEQVWSAVIVILMIWGVQLYLLQPQTIVDILRDLLLQSMIWLMLAGSFIVLLPMLDAQTVLWMIGAFTFSWLVGFLTPIAPGGIGTREFALVVLVLQLFPTEQMIVLSSLHRLLWILTEVLPALGALLIPARGGQVDVA